MYSRTDTNKYAAALRTCRNFIVQRFGGATNRPGTKFVGEVSDSTKSVRLIPFVFNTLQTYVLEFGDLYIRFIRDGAYIKDSTKTITGITQASEGVFTSASHGFADGDEVHISNVLGMVEVNNRNFKVSDSTTNTFKLKLMDGTTYLDTSGFTAYGSNGTAERIYEIATPYVEADLAELKFIQSADVLTIVHQNYPPAELARTGDASWSIDSISFAATIQPPTGVANNGPGAGSAAIWVVTSIDADSFEESVASLQTTSSAAPSGGSPINVTWTLNVNATEYNIYKSLNGVFGFIGNSANDTFTDAGVTPDVSITPPIARNPFGSADTTAITGITRANPTLITSVAHGLVVGDVVLIRDIAETSGTSLASVLNNRYFFVRTVPSVDTFTLDTFNKTAHDTSSGYTAWSSGGTVGKANNYLPATCAYFQQRLGFANTIAEPEKEWFSQTGIFHNFNISTPLQDNDSVTFQLVGKQVNGVHHIVDIGKLTTFTQVGEWTIEGDSSGVLLPTAINPKQQSYNGSDRVIAPVVVDSTVLYVQARGSVLRDFNFYFQSDGYKGNDLSLFSAHLFDLYTMADITYQKIPHSNIWLVRDDGVLLGLTYVVDQNILGWHRHDFENGFVENVCSVPEGNEDALYLTIKRTIDGVEKRYIERLHTRQISDVVESVFLDSSYSYDGRNTTAVTMTMSGGTTWDYTDTLTLTASSATFSSLSIGDEVHLTGPDGDIIRFNIETYTSTTVVQGRPNRLVPASMQSVATSTWSYALSSLDELWHLEGQDVAVFADGFVVSNPTNASYDVITVSNGSITLPKAYGIIHVGIPITADIETLDIDTVQNETISDKQKTVNRVSVRVVNSRGLWAGSEAPSNDAVDPVEGLVEFKLRDTETMDEPVSLKTDVIDVVIQPQWNSNGRIFLRQIDPVPATISAITVDGMFPFRASGG